MRWTIGMPAYDNLAEVWFTVQSLRLHHDLKALDAEILVIDNKGDDGLRDFIKDNGRKMVRYERCNEVAGCSYAKNKIFEHAKGEYVLVMDSHVLLKRGALDEIPPGDDMIQGPCMQSNQKYYWLEWLEKWRGNMWGIWGNTVCPLPQERREIWAMGAGFFACRRDSWLGFNDRFRGFGGETGYIQEKYRQAGRRVWMYPNMVWMHLFHSMGRQIKYPLILKQRVKNYIIGFQELGLSTRPIRKHFTENNKNGDRLYAEAEKEVRKEEDQLESFAAPSVH